MRGASGRPWLRLALAAVCARVGVHGLSLGPVLAELLPPQAPLLRASQQCLHPTERAGAPPAPVAEGAYAYDLVVAMLSVRSHTDEIRAHRSLARVGGPCSILHVLVFADDSLSAARAVKRDSNLIDLTVATIEAYGNLPAKVLAAFSWLNSRVAFKYVLKTDDDAAICVGGLLRALAPLPRAALYWGKLRAGGLLVELSGKWADTGYATIFGTPTYGDYAFGAGYMLSRDLAGEAVSRASGLAGAMRVEDGLIGAALLGVGRLEIVRGVPQRASADPTDTSASQLVELIVRTRWEPVAGALAPRAPDPEGTSASAGSGVSSWLPPVQSLGRWASLRSPARVYVVNTSAVVDRSPFKSRTLGETTLSRLCGSHALAGARRSFADVQAAANPRRGFGDDRPARRALGGFKGNAFIVHRLAPSSLRRCMSVMRIRRQCADTRLSPARDVNDTHV